MTWEAYPNRMLIQKASVALGGDLKQWSRQCHAASIRLVKAGVADRVARGSCKGVGVRQHSWAVLGGGCYDEDATIIDPTLWSWDKKIKGVWLGSLKDGLHRPHGMGSIWEWGQPISGGGEPILLTPKKPLSKLAQDFLELLGPLDRLGWKTLTEAPVQEWPAAEILAAIEDTKELKALVPIDSIGMLTDRNPGGLYLRQRIKR